MSERKNTKIKKKRDRISYILPSGNLSVIDRKRERERERGKKTPQNPDRRSSYLCGTENVM